MDIAERNGADLRRSLASAERLSEAAIARAERCVKIPGSRSSALLVRPTAADQRLRRVVRRGAWVAAFFMGASRGITIQLEPFRPARFPGASGVGRPSHKLRAHADGPAAGCGVTWRHSYTAR